MRTGRWDAFFECLRRCVVSVCCAGGGLLGLWQGMLAAPLSSNTTRLLPALTDLLAVVAWRVALGVALGATFAALVCAFTPGLRRSYTAGAESPVADALEPL